MAFRSVGAANAWPWTQWSIRPRDWKHRERLIWQRRGLGFEFLDCVEAALQNLFDYREMYQIRYTIFSRLARKKIPFFNFFSIKENEIVVDSVFDKRQDPKKKP
jgi:toxin ParE1/3/4